MGENEKQNVDFYISTDEGSTWKKFEQINEINYSFNSDKYTCYDHDISAISWSIPCDLILSKHERCANRKRFVKLLMSIGYSRNFANWYAWYVNLIGKSYQNAWLDIYFSEFFA